MFGRADTARPLGKSGVMLPVVVARVKAYCRALRPNGETHLPQQDPVKPQFQHVDTGWDP